MKLDVKAVAVGAYDDARALLEPKIKELGARGVALARSFARIEEDTHDTLAALELAESPAEAEALHEDLGTALSMRKRILLAGMAAELGSAEAAALDAALEVGTKVALIIARAFLPIP